MFPLTGILFYVMKSGRPNVFCGGDLLQYNKPGRVLLAVGNRAIRVFLSTVVRCLGRTDVSGNTLPVLMYKGNNLHFVGCLKY